MSGFDDASCRAMDPRVTAREVVVTRHGPPEVLQVREARPPAPGPGEVRIAVQAAGVNFADVMARVGVYPDAPPPPMVVGYEVAGTIDAVGPGVSTRREGDRVLSFTRFGGYSDSVVVRDAYTFEPPAGLSHVEAAAIPVNYLTAYLTLFRAGNLAAGETVLIHGIGGGVGIAALQLARLRGARVIGTASGSKHDALRAMGASDLIDYRTQDVRAEVRRLTEGRGVDVVHDPLGGRSIRESYSLLAPLGRLIVNGASRALPGERRSLWTVLRTFFEMPWIHPLRLLNDNRGVFGLNLGRLWTEVAPLTEAMRFVLSEVEAGRLRPVVAKAFPLEQAALAHRFLQSRANVGKIVLTCGP
jgi:NADPH:quinone reductase-like Zn-dependent oxidoreductase